MKSSVYQHRRNSSYGHADYREFAEVRNRLIAGKYTPESQMSTAPHLVFSMRGAMTSEGSKYRYQRNQKLASQ